MVTINCELIWLYLQDYRNEHGQHNVQSGYSLLNFSHHSKREEKPITSEENLEGQTCP
jgi:hypothetical protein